MEFVGHPKTKRFFRDIVVTEKLDGTNACVILEPLYDNENPRVQVDDFLLDFGIMDEATQKRINGGIGIYHYKGTDFIVGAQSRNRLITPAQDNAGFAKWVVNNIVTLIEDLGPGRHMGEWYGQGIQRNYGLDHKRFALFNTHRYSKTEFTTPNLSTVPVLYHGPLSELGIKATAAELRMFGSQAVEGFMNPEGVCVYHEQARQIFKYTPDHNEDGHKG